MRHNLRTPGISESNARKWGGSNKGYWRVAGSKVVQVSLPNAYWNCLGLRTLEPDLAASQSDGLTNRRMRARMSGGVGGGGATPPPYPITDLPRQRPGSYQEDREESTMAALISGRSREELLARFRDDRTE
jgi:hypothetical protein